MDASKRTKKISMTFVGFIYALSNHESCLTKRVEGNGENRKPQLMLGTFFGAVMKLHQITWQVPDV